MIYAHRYFGAFLALVASVLGNAGVSAAPMTFRTMPIGDGCGVRCPQMIVAEGEITTSTPERFAEFVRRQSANPNARSVILLHSQGGRVGASMQLGKIFRQVGAAVIVGRAGPAGVLAGSCYSACVYALIGGKKRVIPRVSRIGVHRMFAYDVGGRGPEDIGGYEAIYATPDLVGRLSDYVRSMGVSRELIVTAERVDHNRIRIVTPQEIRRWKIGSEKF